MIFGDNAHQLQNNGYFWEEMGVTIRTGWSLSCICSIVCFERSVGQRNRVKGEEREGMEGQRGNVALG